MSVPKSFEQVLREWRAEDEKRGKLGGVSAGMSYAYASCADEAQPILDKLRELVKNWRQEVDAVTVKKGLMKGAMPRWAETRKKDADNLERALRERES